MTCRITDDNRCRLEILKAFGTGFLSFQDIVNRSIKEFFASAYFAYEVQPVRDESLREIMEGLLPQECRRYRIQYRITTSTRFIALWRPYHHGFEPKNVYYNRSYLSSMFGNRGKEYSLKELSDIVGQIAPKYHITAVYLFGSRARGDNRRDSDYDMMVETGPGFRSFDLFHFEDEMRAVLRRDVGAMTTSVLRNDNDFTRDVLRERVLIYG